MTAAPLALEARRALSVLAVVTLITCAFSVGYFHPDEHFQILELASYKLGWTPRAEMPWEFGRQMRPWLQPALVWVVARACRAAGVDDPFTVAALLRALHAVVSLAATRRLLGVTARSIADASVARTHVWVMALAGFLPYLFARTSSENLSGALLAFAAAEILDGVGAERSPAPRLVALGALLGLAFDVRYQTALASGGALAWLVVLGGARARALALVAAGGALALAAGAAADAWGYGHVCFPAWTYVKVNVFEGVSNDFGREPFFAFLYLPVANVCAVPAAIAVLGVVVHWVRRPRELLSWMTGAFVVGQSVLAHKEERFVFPAVILAVAMITPAFAPGPRYPRALARLFDARLGALGKVLAAGSLIPMIFLAFYPLNWRSQAQAHRFLYRGTEPGTMVVTKTRTRFEDPPYYSHHKWDIDRRDAPGCIADLARSRPTYLVVDGPVGEVDEAAWGVSAELVFVDFPLFERSAWVRESVAPAAERAARRLVAASGGTAPRPEWHAIYRARPAACR
ncbi:MAG: hypothetical protein JNL38_41625 [Myxococcales bacterium]|nr:hypothetical protein [Myxococcales bacterium]